MSQTIAQAPARSAKNLVAAFYAVADEIDETQRLPIILAAAGQIIGDARTLSRPASLPLRAAKTAKMSRGKKAAKEAKPGILAAPNDATTPAATPTNAVIAMPKTRRAAKAKAPMRRAAAANEAGNVSMVA